MSSVNRELHVLTELAFFTISHTQTFTLANTPHTLTHRLIHARDKSNGTNTHLTPAG